MLKSIHGKVTGLIGALTVGAGALVAGDTPVIPTTALAADYSVFDYVFAGAIGVALVFMVAKKAKSFIS